MNKQKKAEISEVTVSIIVILVIIFIGLAVIFSKIGDFKSFLGL